MTYIASIIQIAGPIIGAAGSAYAANRNRQTANSAAAAGASAADPAASYRPGFMAYLQGMFPQLASVSYNDIEADPAFKFMHDEGMRDINNKASAEGTLRSGTVLEDMSKFNTGLSDTFINSQFQRNMALMGQLGNFSGLNIGNPGVAGQITANAGLNNFNMGNNVLSQIGSGVSMAGRLWGSPSGGGMSNGSGASSTVDNTTWGGA